MAFDYQNYFRSFSYKGFRNFILFRVLFTFTIQMNALALSWWIYELTEDVWALGLIGLCEAIPALSITLFAGYLADKYSRQKILLISGLWYLLTLCGLSMLSVQNNLNIDLKLNLIYLGVMCMGIARGFIAPSVNALLSQIVTDKNHFVNAAIWSSWSWQFTSVIGPIVAGFAYEPFGIKSILIIGMMFVIIALINLLMVGSRPLTHVSENDNIFENIKAGIAFIKNNNIILGALSLDMLAVLFGGAVAMLPAFADQVLFVGATELGWMRAAPGIGSVITMLFLAYYPPMINAGKKLFISIFIFGVFTFCFAISTNLYLTLFFLILIGAFDSVSVVIRGTIIQILTPNHMRGRVSAVNSLFIGSSNELGAFESGLAAKVLGLVPSVIFGAGMTIGITGVCWKFFDGLKKLSFNK